MFGLSIWEIGFALLLAFIVLGPQKLPELARNIARWVRELQRIAGDLRAGIDDAVREPPPPPPSVPGTHPVLPPKDESQP